MPPTALIADSIASVFSDLGRVTIAIMVTLISAALNEKASSISRLTELQAMEAV